MFAVRLPVYGCAAILYGLTPLNMQEVEIRVLRLPRHWEIKDGFFRRLPRWADRRVAVVE
jgi:hypothetical protein